jgi:D-alanine-D-alanine ligase
MTRLRIAVLANLKENVAVSADAPEDALYEYDSEETVLALKAALETGGHEVMILAGDVTLLDTIRQARPDFCFNICEGLHGDSRESHVPALLEMLRIPYTASQVLTHAISLDKAVTKRIWRDCGLPTAPFQVFGRGDEPLQGDLAFPLFVKPSREGTGMGINEHSVVRDSVELHRQVQWVLRSYRQPALVESYLPGREFTVGILGNRLLPGEAPRRDLYDAQGFHVFPALEIGVGDKGGDDRLYTGHIKSKEPLAIQYLCPAPIPAELAATLRALTVRAYEAIGAVDISRVDFRLGADGRPYLLEINTLPGLNPIISDICIAAQAEQLSYETLIQEILAQAMRRYGV